MATPFRLRDRIASRKIRKQSAKLRLAFEALENRTLLTAITPTTFGDGGAGTGSLRAAVIAANADTTDQPAVINLNAGTYSLSIPNAGGAQENLAVTGDLDLFRPFQSVIIRGQVDADGKPTSIIDATGLQDRVFQLTDPGAVVEFDNLIIRGGTAQESGVANASTGTTPAKGGGILNFDARLTLNNVVLDDNTAEGAPGQNGMGGGVCSEGGSVTITNSTFSSNTAQGGVNTEAQNFSPVGDGQGGGFYARNATTHIQGSTFHADHAFGGGVGANDGHTTIYIGAGQGGGLYVVGGGTSVQASTISENQAYGQPGGHAGGHLQTIFGAADANGHYPTQLFPDDPLQGAGAGGGLFSLNNTTTIRTSTFTNNRAATQGSGARIAYGGGVYTQGGSTTVQACTFSNNIADQGGGLHAANRASIQFGRYIGWDVSDLKPLLQNAGQGSLTLTDSIVAGSWGGDVSLDTDTIVLGQLLMPGLILAGSGNLIQDGSGGLPDTIVADPLLSPLGDYGGPTQTFALLPGSPALGTGRAVAGTLTDQRGVIRTGPIDIGAFQSQKGLTLTINGGDSQSAYLRSSFAVPLTVHVSSPFGEPVTGGKVTFASAASAEGALAVMDNAVVTIGADGSAKINPTANAVAGTYTVSATTTLGNTVPFTLTNLAVPNLLTPTSLSDSLSPGSLRAAIIASNADPATAAHTIHLQAGTYSLTLPGTLEDSGRTGDLDVTSTAHQLIIEGQVDANGHPTTIIDASAIHDRVFHMVVPGTNVQFKNLIIKGGALISHSFKTDRGGGICENAGVLTIQNVVFDSNTAQGFIGRPGGVQILDALAGFDAYGGAVYASAGSVLSITDTTFSSNQVIGGAGGEVVGDNPIYQLHTGPGGGGFGGAIYADGASVTLTSSTFVSNVAQGGAAGEFTNQYAFGQAVLGALGGVGEGGAVLVRNGTLTIINSTFSGNAAQGGDGSRGTEAPANGGAGGDGRAGGIAEYDTSLAIANSTIFGNTAQGGQGRGSAAAGAGTTGGLSITGTGTLTNSILAGNTGGDVAVSGSLTGTHNLIQDGSGGLSDTIVANPLLGALADNGGPTRTMALLAGSPAIDAGNNDQIPAGIITDQSGRARIAGVAADIGAFEQQKPTITSITVQPAGVVGRPASLSATATSPDAALTYTYTWTITRPDKSTFTLTGQSASFVPLDAGSYGVSLTVSDDGGGTATQTSSLAVHTQLASAKLVQALYQYELGRGAGAAEINFQVDALDGTGGQAAMVNGIVKSTESRVRLIAGWFQTYLGRTPSTNETSFWAGLLSGQSEEQALSQIVGSTEFFNRAQGMGFGGTPNQNYIRALYQALLGRAASSAEVDIQVNALAQFGQQGVALSLLQSVEYRANIVRSYYINLLGRTGSSAEVASWVNSSADQRAIRIGIESSQEFFNVNAQKPPTIASFTVPSTGTAGKSVLLSASANNPAGNFYPLIYTWTITRPNGVILSTLAGLSPKFIPTDIGNYSIRLTVTDEDGFNVSRTATEIVSAPIPPKILAAQYSGSTPIPVSGIYYLTVSFSEYVQPTLSIPEFQIHNATTNQDITPTGLQYDTASNTAVLTFNTLADGNYTLTVLAAGITNAAETILDGNGDGTPGGNYTFNFFQLFGDINRDRKVDATDRQQVTSLLGTSAVGPQKGDADGDHIVGFADLVAVAQHYGQAGTTLAQGNFNGDGSTDFGDLVVVAQNYGHSGRADFNGDGVINQADLDLLNAAFGHTLPASASPIAATPAVAPVTMAPTSTFAAASASTQISATVRKPITQTIKPPSKPLVVSNRVGSRLPVARTVHGASSSAHTFSTAPIKRIQDSTSPRAATKDLLDQVNGKPVLESKIGGVKSPAISH